MEVDEMNKKVEVQSALWNDEGKELLLEIDSTLSVNDFEPREQMLVDSDHLSFIYITEKIMIIHISCYMNHYGNN